MKNITDPSDIKTIAVFRPLNLGDMLCAVPALRALRRWLLGTRITYVGLPWSRGFFSRFRHYLDEFIEFPGYPGLPEIVPDVRVTADFLHHMQERRFDLALQMHGNGSITNPLVSMFGALVTAGFCAEGEPFFRDGWAIPYPEELREVNRCLKLVETLGAPPAGTELEFPLIEQDFTELKELPETAHLEPASYIVLHPGAKTRVRRWIPERFAEVCDSLSENRLRVIITGSSGEKEIAERVRKHMKHPAINLAGRTTLGALAALVKNSRLVIANDTGISHIASALHVPSVIVITASDPLRWSPEDTRIHRTVMRQVPCRPCEFPVCPLGHPCAQSVRTDDVIAEAKEILRNTGTPPLRAMPLREEQP